MFYLFNDLKNNRSRSRYFIFMWEPRIWKKKILYKLRWYKFVKNRFQQNSLLQQIWNSNIFLIKILYKLKKCKSCNATNSWRKWKKHNLYRKKFNLIIKYNSWS